MKRLKALRRWFGRRFGYARLVCLALLIGFAALRIADPAPVEELRFRIFDSFQRIDPRPKLANSPVTIVDIDEASLAKLGQWPWSRTRIADMVGNLTQLGAVVIAFDVDLRRARPAQSRRRRRHLPQSRRGDQGQIACAAEQRSGFRRCHAAIARGAGRIRTCRSPRRPRQDASGDGTGDAGRRPAALHVRVPGPVAQYPVAGTGRCRARPAHDQSRARRHRPAGADDHAGAGRDHAVPELRNACG